MLPIELELVNFLSYRNPPPLSFEEIRIGCISGSNHAGKTSILDAITWVLWGRARLEGDKTHRLFVHQGQNHTRVSLIFAHREQRYKVTRQWRADRGSSGRSTLDLEQWNRETNTWGIISERTIPATQDQIKRLLNLEYETFINTAFLRQGRADEFTTKTADQRKRILSNILNLSDWAKLEQMAKDQRSVFENQIQYLQGQIDMLEQNLEGRREYLHEQERVTTELLDVKRQLSEIIEKNKEQDHIRIHIDLLVNMADNVCPTCHQTLEQEQKENLIREFQAKIHVVDSEQYREKQDFLTKKRDELVGRLASSNHQLEIFEDMRIQLTQCRETIAEHERERDEYRDLIQAFSRRGVPAMIIKNVLPPLENAANELLHKMTEGRLHLRFETERQRQDGDVKETLEIMITDELGCRPYELFSGGEAFRINFAIRIALSKLLASWNDTQLRCLFIDEGFGTQDAQGREYLVEAINGIKDEFDLILVITHIEELKEAFPHRIEVWKTSDGSQFQLV